MRGEACSCLEIERHWVFCVVEQTDGAFLRPRLRPPLPWGPLPCSFQTSFVNVRLIAEGLPRVAMTAQTITIPFRKTAACPSSARLLLLRAGKLSMKASSLVGQHLESCDFCNAELRLLAHHCRTR